MGAERHDVVYNIPGIQRGLKLNATILPRSSPARSRAWSSTAILKLNKNYSQGSEEGAEDHPGVPLGRLRRLVRVPELHVQGRAEGVDGRSVDLLPRHRRPGRERQLRRRRRGRKNAGAIGYISAYYALSQHGIYTASLENAAGNFEQANGATIEEAAKSNSTIPAQGSASPPPVALTIQYPSKKYKTAYPISTYTYAIVNKDEPSIV